MKTYDVVMTPSDDGHWVLKSEADREIRHQKHKRCLELKKNCLMELDYAFRDTCIERSAVKCVLWRKWANRWDYLAQFFKEASDEKI